MSLLSRLSALFARNPNQAGSQPPARQATAAAPAKPKRRKQVKPEIRALVMLAKVAATRRAVKQKRTTLPMRHLRATRMFHANAKTVAIPAGFLARSAFFPDPWWKASEAKQGETPIPKDAPTLPDGSRLIEEVRQEIVLLDGRKVVHVRRVLVNRDGRRRKEFLAEFADGTRTSFDEVPQSLLPLYVPPGQKAPDKGAIVVTEGAPAAVALARHGVPAVATLTGALGTPSRAALELVAPCSPIILWPDNDSVGAQHMQRIAQRLHGMQAKDVRVLRWLGAPRKADAADFTGTRDELSKLLETAQRWSPEDPVRTRGVLAVNPPRSGLKLRLGEAERPTTRASNGRSRLLRGPGATKQP